jgi:hypothetical protein
MKRIVQEVVERRLEDTAREPQRGHDDDEGDQRTPDVANRNSLLVSGGS